MTAQPGVAVVGIGCLFPGAADASAFWANIEAGRDAITEASPARWDPVFHDPASAAPDRLYTRRGGFVGDTFAFDAGRFGIMPVAAAGAEPDQLVALHVAAACLEDAGWRDGAVDRDKIGVILGRGGYLTPGLVRLEQAVRQPEQVAALLRQLAPELDEAVVGRVKAALRDQAGGSSPDSAIGLVPNLAASRIANRLDLRGPAYTLDAACASALLAVEHACRELRAGRLDMVLAGGVHLTHDVTFWSVFAQLGALSRTGRIRPFDRAADGLLVGEGVGIVALKRLDRAEHDGDRIYAVLRGVGSASDGRATSPMVPRVEGQVRALRRAWRDAGMDPTTIGLLEAHGTATPAGDQAELRTVGEVFGAYDGGARAAIGSVKSMIGHTMPAAGAAGLIKAVLAVHHGVIPPSLHCDEPRPELLNTRFEVPGEARPWPGDRRVAAVNAFGFGGIDAHVVLESHGTPSTRPVRAAGGPVLAVAAPDAEALLALLDAGVTRGGSGACRLAVADPTPARVQRARRVVARGERWAGRGGMWFSPQGLVDTGGRVALMFPGIEARFAPETRTVASHFGLAPPEHTSPGSLEETGRGVVALGRFLHDVLGRLGVHADAYAGHSIGEWTAMIAAGVVSAEAVDRFLANTPVGGLDVPGVSFAAAGCGLAPAREAIAGLPDIAVSHDNCPHQVILCGVASSIEAARARLIDNGVVCQVLPFRSGFHSPLFADHLDPHRRHFRDLPIGPPKAPLWSATTCDLYPDDPDQIRDLGVRHLVEPLRFRELTQALHDQGVRVFVQVGAGSLPGFVRDTLHDLPHLAVSASDERRTGLDQLRHLALALFVEGVPVDLDGLVPREPARATVTLRLGTPLISLPEALHGVLSARTERAPATPLRAELDRTMRAMAMAGTDVVAALERRDSWSRTRRLSVRTMPDLADHALFPQPAGWACMADRYPVVPMTTTVELLLDAAREVGGDAVPVEVADLQAHRWLVADPPQDIAIRAERIDHEWVRAGIDGFATARIRMAERVPVAPSPTLGPLVSPRPCPIDAQRLYQDRWMFHGPRFQGVMEIGPLGDNGIDGVIEVPPARGALLDNAGQLLGYWVMATQASDQLAMPVGIRAISLYGPHPAPGERVVCHVRITELGDQILQADLELIRADRVWCRIRGWADHRFETDAAVWQVLRQPEHHLLSNVRDGWVCYDTSAIRAPSRDWLMRRYLGEAERAAMSQVGPREQRWFLDDRIAAKDAVRHLLWSGGAGPMYPVELRLDDDAGKLRVRSPRDLRVAVAHRGDVSVAIAAEGRPVGIHLAEDGSPDHAARSAVARARGLPDQAVEQLVVTDGNHHRMLVDGTLVGLAREGPYLVAWTVP